MHTPTSVLADRLRSDPARPLLTAYDDERQERAELSVATTANWAAKVANYLSDDLDIRPGDVVGIDLPTHWQTAVVLLGLWAVGAEVARRDDPLAFRAVLALVDVGRPGIGGGETVTIRVEPMGAGLSRLVGSQPDHHEPIAPGGASVLSDALMLGVPPGARVLSTLGYDTPAGLGYGLLAPLATGGSVLLAVDSHADALPARAESEKVTATVGVDLPGLPRLDAGG